MKVKVYHWQKIGIIACICMPLFGFSVNQKTVERGDSVILTALSNGRSYQWQVSSDNSAYTNIPSATEKEYRFQAYGPAYYRAVITSEDNQTSYSDTTQIAFTSVTYKSGNNDISAAQGYVEVKGQPGTGINIPGDGRDGNTLLLTKTLTDWTNAQAHAVYYVRHPAALVDAKLLLTITKYATVQFRLRVYNPASPDIPIAETYISLRGTGTEQEIDVFGYKKFPKVAYYRYDLECLKGNTSITQINRWRFLSTSSTTSYAPAYLSSPSVHLTNWKTSKSDAPSGKVFDWCYQEIMIPEEADYTGTYAMSLGVLQGYMGIQVNGTNHDVIFSMWDDGDTDTDPGLANYKKAGAVDASPDVTVSRFGNEGTGVKTFASGQFWKPGTYVQFITNARPETTQYEIEEDGETKTITRENTLVSAWFNAQDGKGWQYIATTRLPGSGHYFESWYSFLENYNWASGQVLRKAYYRNGYIHHMNSDTWYHCNKVTFGNTDGGSNIGARYDFGQGRDNANPNTFFMQTGGYLSKVANASQVSLNTVNTPVDTIKLSTLESRVDLAIVKEEEALKAAEELQESLYDKTGWEVISFSSQEVYGEVDNGRATQIIDDDEDTYWHSSWLLSTAQLPHSFVIDMKQIQPVNGFQFTLSGGSSRHQKGIDIYGSTDNVTWTKIYANDSCPDAESYYLAMDSVVDIRYFKLVINTTQTGSVYTRINEIGVTHPLDTQTGILAPLAKANRSLMAYFSTDRKWLNIVSPTKAEKMEITLYILTGEQVFRTHRYHLSPQEVIRVESDLLTRGVYIAKCAIEGNTYSRLILR